MVFFKELVLVAVTCLVVSLSPLEADAARLLCVAPFFARSHSTFVHAVMLHLAKNGHDVTIITTNPVEDPPPNLRQVEVNRIEVPIDLKRILGTSEIQRLVEGYMVSEMFLENTFESPQVKELMADENLHFDVVIVELFYQDVMSMFAHKYRAQLVLLDTSVLPWHVGELMGNPLSPAFAPHDVYGGRSGEFTIFDRLANSLLVAVDKLFRKFYVLPMQNRVARKYFGKGSNTLPYVEDVYSNASLVLLNTHYSIGMTVPLVPGVVEIGGAHIQPPKTLPDDIKIFLDEAEHGAIYFSMGSLLLSSQMDEQKVVAFLKVFSKLKQRILWKWENDNPPKQDGILTRKWFPQNDILAHPNVKVFINHGGMLSIQEALDKGVPVVGIPVFSDQPMNIAKLKSRGVGVLLDYSTISESSVRKALELVLHDPSYRRNAAVASAQFRGRQSSPLDTALYWINFACKYKGTAVLKSHVVNIAWYKYYFVDILLCVAIFVIAVVYCIKISVIYIMKYFVRKTVRTSKKIKRK